MGEAEGRGNSPARGVYRWIQDTAFAAAWLTCGVILGAAGGWWALLAGPVLMALAVLGGARYRTPR